MSSIDKYVLYNGAINDVTFSFDGNVIDELEQLYGKQFLQIEIRIFDENNVLREQQLIGSIEVCPKEKSPRFFIYENGEGCMNEPISINRYLTNKTHTLRNWTKIEFIVSHRKNLYNGRGHTQQFQIIKEKRVTFDVDLSIPAGLLIKKIGEDGFPGLSGVSLSMLAQFSFYKKGEIQRLRPYKIGAGFIAQNAFNFNEDADRDLGVLIMGSVYPIKTGRKISFPLYAGFGYFLNDERFFYLIGPGIQINF